ncbi:MAG: baseplate J/gp47 family protein [Defluviitaleaceae bacterium]|nr:baseplate J/gp47 family protein [Defluviitaleaceae bacterium]
MDKAQIDSFLGDLRTTSSDPDFIEHVRYILQSVSDMGWRRHDYVEAIRAMLERVPAERDRRQSSIVFNTLAPTAMEQTQMAITIDIHREQKNLLTAQGAALDRFGDNWTLPRQQATKALRIIELALRSTALNFDIATELANARFMTIDTGTPLFFDFHSVTDDGLVLVECEEYGGIGNNYTGEMLPAVTLNNVVRVTMTGIQIPGQNTETDKRYRRRLIWHLANRPFGGNIAHYVLRTLIIDGVGDVVVFPSWQGGGTGKIVLLDTEYNPVNEQFMEIVKNTIDPRMWEGHGMGGFIKKANVKNIVRTQLDVLSEFNFDGILFEDENMGIAPMGHNITIDTPHRIYIDVEITVQLGRGVLPGQAEEIIRRRVVDYIERIKNMFADEWQHTLLLGEGITHEKIPDSNIPIQHHVFNLRIFRSEINALAIQTRLVVDVSKILINGIDSDLVIVQNQNEQYLPYTRNVVIHFD